MTHSKWFARTAVVIAGALAHSLAWLLREEEGGKLAELPDGIWQHAVGVAIGIIIMSVVGPLLVTAPAFLSTLFSRGPRSLPGVGGMLVKTGIFIAIFGIWMPWETWFV